MTALDLMRSDEPYAVSYLDMPNHLQTRAQGLCWRFNQLDPTDAEGKTAILSKLFGTWHPRVTVKPVFRCDYGFNIHFRGFALVNYNCVFLTDEGCSIYPVRPLQCRTYPFWPYLLEDRAILEAEKASCPGIGEGELHSAGEIRQQCRATLLEKLSTIVKK